MWDPSQSAVVTSVYLNCQIPQLLLPTQWGFQLIVDNCRPLSQIIFLMESKVLP